MEKKLFEILACPLCKSDVKYQKELEELVCRPCGMAYPVRDDIPVMLEGEARTLTIDERLKKESS
ncbi:MAG: Trm112 family protein [Candidatus Endonucleobacter sp. (ex Gigantidas childressi)]|nr:Trm112 family protein [Candidatus Endonucleobacter sp. (ex Gigantidas childressi)]